MIRCTKWLFVLVALLLTGCVGGAQYVEPQTRLSAVEAVGGDRGDRSADFARVVKPRPFEFPRDHGPHPEYAIEWWYYTGNLQTDAGRHFGFQLTFFRYGLTPETPERNSDWATSSIYMAHFALADVADERFYAFERLSRGAAGLAGAQGGPTFEVWLEDWRITSENDGLPMRLNAEQDGIAIDLVLDTDRPVVLQGERGYSQKGRERGNSSYYYSFTRLETQGTVTVDGESHAVRGLSWLDHEFGTEVLEETSAGWDWFSIQLDNNTDIMYAQVRTADGSTQYTYGIFIGADGSYYLLETSEATLEVLDTWRSSYSGTAYPSGWQLQIPGENIDLRITPYLRDQELPLSVLYWEGAVQIEGTSNGQSVRGNGYVELTGYGEQQEEGLRIR